MALARKGIRGPQMRPIIRNAK